MSAITNKLKTFFQFYFYNKQSKKINHLIFFTTKIKEILIFYFFIQFKKIKKNENIFIYGFSRGGSTLMAEALVKTMNTRLLWEPLFPHREVFFPKINPYSNYKLKKLGLGWNPFFSEKERIEENYYFDKLFNLEDRNIRLLRFTNHQKFKKQEKSVFKFCFANFLYPYFNKKYNNKSIILFRHPFSIASSSLKFGNNFDYHKKKYATWKYSKNKQSDCFFDQYEDKYALINSGFTLIVFQVVSQFSFLIKEMDQKNSIIVYYEELISNPELVRKKLSNHFNTDIDATLFSNSIKKQSFSSGDNHTLTNTNAQLSKWVKNTPQSDIKRGLEIFNAFNFTLYGNDIYPSKEN